MSHPEAIDALTLLSNFASENALPSNVHKSLPSKSRECRVGALKPRTLKHACIPPLHCCAIALSDRNTSLQTRTLHKLEVEADIKGPNYRRFKEAIHTILRDSLIPLHPTDIASEMKFYKWSRMHSDLLVKVVEFVLSREIQNNDPATDAFLKLKFGHYTANPAATLDLGCALVRPQPLGCPLAQQHEGIHEVSKTRVDKCQQTEGNSFFDDSNDSDAAGSSSATAAGARSFSLTASGLPASSDLLETPNRSHEVPAVSEDGSMAECDARPPPLDIGEKTTACAPDCASDILRHALTLGDPTWADALDHPFWSLQEASLQTLIPRNLSHDPDDRCVPVISRDSRSHEDDLVVPFL